MWQQELRRELKGRPGFTSQSDSYYVFSLFHRRLKVYVPLDEQYPSYAPGCGNEESDSPKHFKPSCHVHQQPWIGKDSWDHLDQIFFHWDEKRAYRKQKHDGQCILGTLLPGRQQGNAEHNRWKNLPEQKQAYVILLAERSGR